MSLSRGKISIMLMTAIFVLHFIAGHTLAAPNILHINITTPLITSGTPAKIRITVTNTCEDPVAFDRATIAYVNPNLTFSGPYEVKWPEKLLLPGGKVTVIANITINTSQPSGTLVPLSLSLFYKTLSTGDPNSFRGTTMGAAKVL